MDELDHLGSYLTRNRSDMFNDEQFDAGATFLTHAGASDIVDAYFADPDWRGKPAPRQKYPTLLEQFLQSIDKDRGPRFLHADSLVRDFSSDARMQVSGKVASLLPTLRVDPYRWFMVGGGSDVTLVWLQRSNYADVEGVMFEKAEAAALSMGMQSCHVLVMYVDPHGSFQGGWATEHRAPSRDDVRYVSRAEEGLRMARRALPL